MPAFHQGFRSNTSHRQQRYEQVYGGCNEGNTHDDPYLAGFTYDKMLHTMPDDAYDVIMKIHVRAPFRLVRAAAPYFRVKVSASRHSMFIFTMGCRAELQQTVPSSTFPPPLVFMEMSARQTMPLPRLRWSGSPRRSRKSGVRLVFAQIPLRMAPFTRGTLFLIRSPRVGILNEYRLTAAKEDGAMIEIEGKKVALGIPTAQARTAQGVNPYEDVPLRRGASTDEAAAAMLL